MSTALEHKRRTLKRIFVFCFFFLIGIYETRTFATTTLDACVLFVRVHKRFVRRYVEYEKKMVAGDRTSRDDAVVVAAASRDVSI